MNIEISVEERGGDRIATITIANEAKLNTLTSDMIRQLRAGARELALDDALRAVILTGEGEKSFIAGANIEEMRDLDRISSRNFITTLHEAFLAVRDIPVPVIARIQGYCFGAGLELAASCDLRVAAETAKLGMPEPVIGLPSVIEAALLPSLVGWGKTRELLYLGETITATEAHAIGLVERVVSPHALDAGIESILSRILSGGAQAIRLQKRLIRQWERVSLKDAVHAGIDCFADAYLTDEPRAMLAAWLESRKK